MQKHAIIPTRTQRKKKTVKSDKIIFHGLLCLNTNDMIDTTVYALQKEVQTVTLIFPTFLMSGYFLFQNRRLHLLYVDL